MPSPLWRFAAAILAAIALIWSMIALCAWIFAPSSRVAGITSDPDPEQETIAAARARKPDLNDPLVLWQDVDYSEGPAAAWYPKGEAPLLQELVNEGKLPPVAERVGSEPLVLKGVDGIGTYGGIWIEATWATSWLNQINRAYSYSNLARWSPRGYPVVPHVAKGWEVNEDSTEFTIFLRRGMRWSDGHPLTADDVMYWYEHEVLDESVGGSEFVDRRLFEHVNEVGTLHRVDDFAVKFVFQRPHGLFIQQLASVLGNVPVNSPRHYLMQYHPRLGDQELIERKARELGLPSGRALYTRLKRPDNPEHPRLWPWIYRTYKDSPPYGFVRNPYYFAVDTEGNQLPYFDRFHWEVKSPELLGIAAASGELTLQTVWPPLNQYTLLMSNRERHGYNIRHWFATARSSMVINPNLNRKVLPGDPTSRWKHQLLTDKRFRQALSLAIDRRAIIDTAFLGLGEPSQIEPGPGSPFHSEKLAKAFIEHDPARASAMLDELELTQRDAEGYRTFPDGTRMEFYLHTIASQDSGAMQMIVDDWAEVGVRAKVLVRSQSLWRSEISALIHDFSVAESLSEFIPTNNPRPFVPWGSWSDYAQGYAIWYMQGGMWGDPRSKSLATQGPSPDDPIYHAMELYNEVRQAPTLDKQVEIFQRILDLAAENLWTINIATAPPYLILVKDGVRNVPDFAIAGNHHYTPGSTGLETYFQENAQVSPAALAHMRTELTTPGRLPGAARTEEKSSSVLAWLLGAGAAIGLLSLAIRHPFVARRMVLMVPTLAVISVLTFIIIQLPPGDYITTMTIRLQEEGSEASEQQIREIRELFHLDKSPVRQYLQWSGLAWFGSFAPEDRGLLQGDLGRSMETLRPVNNVVGDRILLTILISAGTILLTWSLAIPIGIYSAVRQYSPGDYAATLLGLIGMSVPNFLLAILAMYFASRMGLQVTGLLSPEYAVQPGWTWPKVVDLLKHIWVPVLILGLGGTASMVRVMRGNLLDELDKPYVRTARAKGLKPWRVILKYPVRLAINPFVSGIGTLFPQLISGGAITAVILSLPTVGPLMLEAFRSEDMYLAGSMLMVLSFLGIFGTLVSDLLLLALDPRIRMERSGTR